MDYMLLRQVCQPLIDITYDFPTLRLFQTAPALQHLGLEITLITEFCYDVAIVGTGNDIVAAENIGMV